MGSVGPSGTTVILPLVLVGVVVLGFGFAVLVVRAFVRRARGRSIEFTEFASARGLTRTSGETGLADLLAPEPFSRGHLRQSGNVVRGTVAGRSVLAFDYSYRTSSLGDHDRLSQLGVVALALPAALPGLAVVGGTVPRLAPKGARPRPTGDAGFDAVYRTFTDAPDFAAVFLNPAVRRWLVAEAPPSLWVQGRDAVVFTPALMTSPELDRWMGFLVRLVREIPDAVWRWSADRPS